METHRFTPSRPNGTVCVAWRDLGIVNGVRGSETCGFPASHAIHETEERPTDAQAREMRDRDPLGDWYPIGTLAGDAEHVAQLVRGHMASATEAIAALVVKLDSRPPEARQTEAAPQVLSALQRIAEYVASAGRVRDVQPIRNILGQLKRNGVEL